jgi:adenosylhomocysteine nucleosidase
MQRLYMNEALLVFALHAEAQKQFDALNVLFCGVGKVNAAYRLTHTLGYWRQRNNTVPRIVLNLGSAGSTHFQRGTIVNCTKFVQRDFDVTALGHAPFMTPGETLPATLTNGLRFEGFPEGTCGTGDNFSTDNQMVEWNVVDMEAYALAKVCAYENIPFACLKYITDGGDESAAGDWKDSLSGTAALLREAVNKIF